MTAGPCGQSTSTRVRSFITENFYVADQRSLGDEVSLLDSGILDSTGVLELVSFLEERFGLKVLDEELVPDNLDSIANIARFVEQKRLPLGRTASTPAPNAG